MNSSFSRWVGGAPLCLPLAAMISLGGLFVEMPSAACGQTALTAPQGLPRRWEAGMAVSPYSTVNLRTGRVVTTLSVVGWEGRGPAVSFSFYHNMTSAVGVLPIEGGESAGLMGDANVDGKLDEDDIDPFVDIVLAQNQMPEEVAIADFSGDQQADLADFDGFIDTLMMVQGPPSWRHSYSMSMTSAYEFACGGREVVTLVRDDGTADTFTWHNTESRFVSPPGVYDTLTRHGTGQNVNYLLRSKNQYVACLKAGRLAWIADATTALDGEDLPKNRLSMTYITSGNGAGKLGMVTDAAGRELLLEYNDYDEIRTITDPVGRVWTCLYFDENDPDNPGPDADGYFVGFQDPNPEHDPIRWDYTEDNEIEWIKDKNGEEHSFVYYEGRLQEAWDPLGLHHAFQYVGTLYGELRCKHTDQRGNLWKYTFHMNGLAEDNTPIATGNLIEIENPLEEVTRFEYEDLRNPSDSAPSCSTPNWFAPHRHEVTARVNALEKRWEFTYYTTEINEFFQLFKGNLATATDPYENAWSFAYDGLNNLIQVNEPGDEAQTVITTAIEYLALIDPEEPPDLENFIDPTLPTKVTLPPDESEEPGYINLTYWAEQFDGHARGQLRSVSDPNGVETMFRYHWDGQLGMIEEGPTATAGNWWKVFDLLRVDAVGRVKQARHYGSRVNLVGGSTELGTCPPGPVIIPCPPDDSCSDYNLDDYPEATICCCTPECTPPCCTAADPHGAVESESVTTALQLCGGYFINGERSGEADYEHDGMGRVVEGSAAAADTSLWPNVNFTVSGSYGYDALGRVISAVTTSTEAYAEGVMRGFYYEYDDVNGVLTRIGPDGETTTYELDIAARLARLTRGAFLVGYEYWPTGQVKKITNNNSTRTLYEYDDAERLTLIRHERAESTLIFQQTFEYNARGLIIRIVDAFPNRGYERQFGYDSRGRLIFESRTIPGPWGARREIVYSYDQGGNRIEKTTSTRMFWFESDLPPLTIELVQYHYDLENPAASQSMNNRLLYFEVFEGLPGEPFELVERVDYAYELQSNAAGNPTAVLRKVPGPPDEYQAFHLQYNHSGEFWLVTERTWTGNCGSPQVRRITEYLGSGRSRYLTRQRDPADPTKVLEGSERWSDYDGGEVYADYLVDRETGQTATLMGYEPGIGQIDWLTTEVRYFHGDQIGTLRVMTNHLGEETANLGYTAFGEVIPEWTSGDAATRYRYAGAWGYQTDATWGDEPGAGVPFVHVGHRWYDPRTGRFLQRDSIGITGGINVYEYANSSPLGMIDPFGKCGYAGVIGRLPQYPCPDEVDDPEPMFDFCAAAAGIEHGPGEKGHRKERPSTEEKHTRSDKHSSKKMHKAKAKGIKKGTWKLKFNFIPLIIECDCVNWPYGQCPTCPI